MPYTITSLDDGGIITSFSGLMTDALYIAAIHERWCSDEAVKNCRYFISDLTEVEQLELTTAGVQESARINTEVSKLNKNILAVGVLPTDLEFGMGRMWQVYADDTKWKTHVCRTLEEAMEWIKNNL